MTFNPDANRHTPWAIDVRDGLDALIANGFERAEAVAILCAHIQRPPGLDSAGMEHFARILRGDASDDEGEEA